MAEGIGGGAPTGGRIDGTSERSRRVDTGIGGEIPSDEAGLWGRRRYLLELGMSETSEGDFDDELDRSIDRSADVAERSGVNRLRDEQLRKINRELVKLILEKLKSKKGEALSLQEYEVLVEELADEGWESALGKMSLQKVGFKNATQMFDKLGAPADEAAIEALFEDDQQGRDLAVSSKKSGSKFWSRIRKNALLSTAITAGVVGITTVATGGLAIPAAIAAGGALVGGNLGRGLADWFYREKQMYRAKEGEDTLAMMVIENRTQTMHKMMELAHRFKGSIDRVERAGLINEIIQLIQHNDDEVVKRYQSVSKKAFWLEAGASVIGSLAGGAAAHALAAHFEQGQNLANMGKDGVRVWHGADGKGPLQLAPNDQVGHMMKATADGQFRFVVENSDTQGAIARFAAHNYGSHLGESFHVVNQAAQVPHSIMEPGILDSFGRLIPTNDLFHVSTLTAEATKLSSQMVLQSALTGGLGALAGNVIGSGITAATDKPDIYGRAAQYSMSTRKNLEAGAGGLVPAAEAAKARDARLGSHTPEALRVEEARVLKLKKRKKGKWGLLDGETDVILGDEGAEERRSRAEKLRKDYIDSIEGDGEKDPSAGPVKALRGKFDKDRVEYTCERLPVKGEVINLKITKDMQTNPGDKWEFAKLPRLVINGVEVNPDDLDEGIKRQIEDKFNGPDAPDSLNIGLKVVGVEDDGKGGKRVKYELVPLDEVDQEPIADRDTELEEIQHKILEALERTKTKPDVYQAREVGRDEEGVKFACTPFSKKDIVVIGLDRGMSSESTWDWGDFNLVINTFDVVINDPRGELEKYKRAVNAGSDSKVKLGLRVVGRVEEDGETKLAYEVVPMNDIDQASGELKKPEKTEEEKNSEIDARYQKERLADTLPWEFDVYDSLDNGGYNYRVDPEVLSLAGPERVVLLANRERVFKGKYRREEHVRVPGRMGRVLGGKPDMALHTINGKRVTFSVEAPLTAEELTREYIGSLDLAVQIQSESESGIVCRLLSKEKIVETRTALASVRAESEKEDDESVRVTLKKDQPVVRVAVPVSKVGAPRKDGNGDKIGLYFCPDITVTTEDGEYEVVYDDGADEYLCDQELMRLINTNPDDAYYHVEITRHEDADDGTVSYTYRLVSFAEADKGDAKYKELAYGDVETSSEDESDTEEDAEVTVAEREKVARLRSEIERLLATNELESPEVYIEALRRVTEILRTESGVVDLERKDVPTIILSDLHGRKNFIGDVLLGDYQGVPVLDLLAQGRINIVCEGDGLHTEKGINWNVVRFADEPGWEEFTRLKKAYEAKVDELKDKYKAQGQDYSDARQSAYKDPELVPYRDAYRPEYARAYAEMMRLEMASGLGAMRIVMEAKTAYPKSFHFIRGNHDVIDDSSKGFYKYAEESRMVRDWMEQFGGSADMLQAYAEFEDQLPYVVVGGAFAVSHAAPGGHKSQEVSEWHYPTVSELSAKGRDLVDSITWTDNTPGEATAEQLAQIEANVARLKSELGLPPNSRLFIGHRNSFFPPDIYHLNRRYYRSQFDGGLIQTNNPDKMVIAIVPPDGSFDPDKHVVVLSGRDIGGVDFPRPGTPNPRTESGESGESKSPDVKIAEPLTAGSEHEISIDSIGRPTFDAAGGDVQYRLPNFTINGVGVMSSAYTTAARVAEQAELQRLYDIAEPSDKIKIKIVNPALSIGSEEVVVYEVIPLPPRVEAKPSIMYEIIGRPVDGKWDVTLDEAKPQELGDLEAGDELTLHGLIDWHMEVVGVVPSIRLKVLQGRSNGHQCIIAFPGLSIGEITTKAGEGSKISVKKIELDNAIHAYKAECEFVAPEPPPVPPAPPAPRRVPATPVPGQRPDGSSSTGSPAPLPQTTTGPSTPPLSVVPLASQETTDPNRLAPVTEPHGPISQSSSSDSAPSTQPHVPNGGEPKAVGSEPSVPGNRGESEVKEDKVEPGGVNADDSAPAPRDELGMGKTEGLDSSSDAAGHADDASAESADVGGEQQQRRVETESQRADRLESEAREAGVKAGLRPTNPTTKMPNIRTVPGFESDTEGALESDAYKIERDGGGSFVRVDKSPVAGDEIVITVPDFYVLGDKRYMPGFQFRVADETRGLDALCLDRENAPKIIAGRDNVAIRIESVNTAGAVVEYSIVPEITRSEDVEQAGPTVVDDGDSNNLDMAGGSIDSQVADSYRQPERPAAAPRSQEHGIDELNGYVGQEDVADFTFKYVPGKSGTSFPVYKLSWPGTNIPVVIRNINEVGPYVSSGELTTDGGYKASGVKLRVVAVGQDKAKKNRLVAEIVTANEKKVIDRPAEKDATPEPVTDLSDLSASQADSTNRVELPTEVEVNEDAERAPFFNTIEDASSLSYAASNLRELPGGMEVADMVTIGYLMKALKPANYAGVYNKNDFATARNIYFNSNNNFPRALAASMLRGGSKESSMNALQVWAVEQAGGGVSEAPADLAATGDAERPSESVDTP